MRILFLDDNPARLRWARRTLGPGHHLVLAETAADAIGYMNGPVVWDLVFLDHDLGGETFVDPSDPNTGSAVVRWVVSNHPAVWVFVVHSMNTPAAHGMAANLRDEGYRAEYVMFPYLASNPDVVPFLLGLPPVSPRRPCGEHD